MIKAIVVDDEPLARSRLNRLLVMQGVDVVALGENGRQAVDLVLKHDVDILFIDINMPIMSGLDAVRELSSKTDNLPAVVFCTAYDEYALDAFQTDAVAYLLKPIQLSDIENAINKAASVNKFQREQLYAKDQNTLTLAINYQGALQNMPIERFLFFRSESKNVFAVLDDQQEVLVDETLKNLEANFTESFIRLHRSILMNKSHASRLIRDEQGGVFVELYDDNYKLPVSRRHLAEVKKCFQ